MSCSFFLGAEAAVVAGKATLSETGALHGVSRCLGAAALGLALYSGAVLSSGGVLSGAHAAGFELNGRALGDRIDEVLADQRYDCGGVSACFLLTACSFRAARAETVYGAPLSALTLHYLGERVAAIEARFAPARFDAVVEAALREHGPAQRDAQPAGAAGNAVYTWRQGARLLRLERFFAGGDSSLIIAQQSLLGELLAQPQE
jgi:hypothetical protein